MDIRCKHCGEPWDTDEFHNGTDSWLELINLFKIHGCPIAEQACDGLSPVEISVKTCKSKPMFDEETMEGLDLIGEMLGDDIDGIAVMTEDFMLRR